MNNRFKFRFWDKETQTMQKIPMVELRHRITLDKIFADDRVIFMQCTGLKDKNGKLIYEGDIVKYKDEVYGLCIGRIEWDNAHYELQYYTGEKYGWFSHILCLKHIKNIEVIGNIYENKELLESEG